MILDICHVFEARRIYVCAEKTCLRKFFFKVFDDYSIESFFGFAFGIRRLLKKNIIKTIRDAKKSSVFFASRIKILNAVVDKKSFILVAPVNLATAYFGELKKKLGAERLEFLINLKRNEISKSVGLKCANVIALSKGRVANFIFWKLKRLAFFDK